MPTRRWDVTVVERVGGTDPSAHLAALTAAARAHPGQVITLTGAAGRELARAVDGPPASVADAPAWRIETGPAGTGPTGSHAIRRVALLDRDGTVIEDRHYLADPAGVSLLPGAVAGLRALRVQGVLPVILTNQSGVGRGTIGPDQLQAIHRRLEQRLAEDGITLGGIFSCPHRPEDGCQCRKPAPGLAHRAAAELEFAVADAVVVGDKGSDLELGHRLGVPAILVRTGEGMETLRSGAVTADYLVDDLVGAAGLLSHPAGLPVPVRADPG